MTEPGSEPSKADFRLSPGDRLGPYEIVGPLDDGGMGEVYRARDPRLRRDVAIKILHRSLAVTPEHVARLASRGARGRQPEPPQHRGGPRRGHRGRRALRRLRAAPGRDAAQASRPRSPAVPEGARLRHPDRGGAGGGPREGDLAPRRQAEQRVHHHRRPRQAPRFRPGQAERAGEAVRTPEESTARCGHEARGRPRNPRLHVAGAAPGGGGGPPHRPLRARRRPLRDVRRQARLPPGHDRRNHAGGAERRPAQPAGAELQLCPRRRCAWCNAAWKRTGRSGSSPRGTWLSISGSSRRSPRPPVSGPVRRLAARRVAVLAVGPSWPGGRRRRGDAAAARPRTSSRSRFAAAASAARASPPREGRSSTARRAKVGPWTSGGSAGPTAPSRASLGHKGSDVLAVRGGKLALSLNRRFVMGERFVGTLAEAPIGEGTPRELAEDVEDADWDLAGTQLAVARSTGAGRGEPPRVPRRPRRSTRPTGSIRSPRFSRDGRRIAFLEDPTGRGAGGKVAVVDLDGQVTPLTDDWPSARGLAWSPTGDEVWFAAGDSRTNRALRAVDLDRRAAPDPADARLVDLVGHRARRARPARPATRNGAPWSASLPARPGSATCPGSTPRVSPTCRRTAGRSCSMTASVSTSGARTGRPRQSRPRGGLRRRLLAGWQEGPGHDRVRATSSWCCPPEPVVTRVTAARPRHRRLSGRPVVPGWPPHPLQRDQAGRQPPLYVQDLQGGPPRPLTPENIWVALDLAGRRMGGGDRAGAGHLALAGGGGGAAPVPSSRPGDRPVAWSADGRSLWVFRRGEVPAEVSQLAVDSGQRHAMEEAQPARLERRLLRSTSSR